MTLVPSSHSEKLVIQILWGIYISEKGFQLFHGEILMLLTPVPPLEINGLPGSS